MVSNASHPHSIGVHVLLNIRLTNQVSRVPAPGMRIELEPTPLVKIGIPLSPQAIDLSAGLRQLMSLMFNAGIQYRGDGWISGGGIAHLDCHRPNKPISTQEIRQMIAVAFSKFELEFE